MKVTAITTLQVHRNGRKHNLYIKMMSSKHFEPLLSRQTCAGFDVLEWINVDSIRPLEDSPQPSSVNKFDALQTTEKSCFDKVDIQHQYADVFQGL